MDGYRLAHIANFVHHNGVLSRKTRFRPFWCLKQISIEHLPSRRSGTLCTLGRFGLVLPREEDTTGTASELELPACADISVVVSVWVIL